MRLGHVRNRSWQPWFAWKPVVTDAGERVWLEWVERAFWGIPPIVAKYRRP